MVQAATLDILGAGNPAGFGGPVWPEVDEPLPERQKFERLRADALTLRTPITLAEGHSGGQWKMARHHAVFDWEFRNLLRSPDLDCLIIRAPVRHGKSQYLARWAPAWYMLRHPARRLMIATHTAKLAKAHSKWVRDQVHMLAPLAGFKGIDPGQAAAGEWNIDGPGMGGCVSAGVGGSVVGYGADLFLIDDYMRNAKAAQSETTREDHWEWFTTTVNTRLSPNGKVVLLCTQWHDDDLIGRVLARKDDLGLRVRSVTLQAIWEPDGTRKDPLGRQPGEALWPEQWPVEKLRRKQRLMSTYWWNALYQSRLGNDGQSEWPAEYFANIYADEPGSGGKNEWPDRFQIEAIYCDPSLGRTSKKGDYAAIVFVGYARDRLWVDCSIDRWPAPVLARKLAAFAKQYHPRFLGIESNGFQELLAPEYLRACEEVGYPADEPILVNNDLPKLLRIRRLGSYLRERELVFKRSLSAELLIRQCKAFPYGDHDDGPDGLDGAVHLLCACAQEMNERNSEY